MPLPVLFRQLFDETSYTYTYLLADRQSREAILIDPVRDKVPSYLQLLQELQLTLLLTVDTHTHADHITGSGLLREQTACTALTSHQSHIECASAHFGDGDKIHIGSIELDCLYTPGHTNDSYSFYDKQGGRVFTGDTLLIRGSGRTDFQGGDAGTQYDSLQRLLALPADVEVYPGHDYKGWMVSTIAEEKQHNPRLQTGSKAGYIELMSGLRLANPTMMDIAVPANRQCGNPLPISERQ